MHFLLGGQNLCKLGIRSNSSNDGYWTNYGYWINWTKDSVNWTIGLNNFIRSNKSQFYWTLGITNIDSRQRWRRVI
ncbi:hypothetical protein RclHR1_08600007 [Rhizophagus clarus]|uniref:Uncharacterized protein n=1 Tax=Rhizophagus clarus TaxID=94130 RepID=A0A2Z6SNS4_9GLOM|nr:hypothetical protein RclHR1_08600007 [Rhizophagus clarus]